MSFGKKPTNIPNPQVGSVQSVTPPPKPAPAPAAAPVAAPQAPVNGSGAAPAPAAPMSAAQPNPSAQVSHAGMTQAATQAAAAAAHSPIASYTDPRLENQDYKKARAVVMEALLEKIDFNAIDKLPPEVKKEKMSQSAQSLIAEMSIPLNAAQNQLLHKQILDEVLGFGPLELLMRDPDVSDIMINTHKMVYIEKAGKISLTDITFTSERHLLNVIQKIVSMVGRRVDETSPMVDARMPDGSRFNAIIQPLALDGCLVSIRKFKKNKMPLRDYLKYNSMSEDMCHFLEICGNIRLNILVSGGTGSGKTTLLNALSGHIDVGERVITIEDAAELQLHQPHVLRLETRPSNIEGAGEITQRQLVKNALRMRPDRIILGEIRGDEVIDVLAAMNTGHDGSMATIHANNPRDCLSRLENLISLAGVNIPLIAMRQQISSAVNLVVQVARMRDGKRRITHIEEIVGMEREIITTQQLFGYKPGPMDENGILQGEFFSNGLRPRFYEQAAYFGREKELDECLGIRRMMQGG